MRKCNGDCSTILHVFFVPIFEFTCFLEGRFWLAKLSALCR
jgi:hypothetical protein